MSIWNDPSLFTYVLKCIISFLIIVMFAVEIFRERTYRLSFFFFAFLSTWVGIFLSSVVTMACRYYHLTDTLKRNAFLDGFLWVAKDQAVILVGLATLAAIIVRISNKRRKD